MRRSYSWHPPKAWQGDHVRYRMHSGRLAIGRVMRVETFYGFSATDGRARHAYMIRREGNDRATSHGDADIVAVLQSGEAN